MHQHPTTPAIAAAKTTASPTPTASPVLSDPPSSSLPEPDDDGLETVNLATGRTPPLRTNKPRGLFADVISNIACGGFSTQFGDL
mmetsp:Transcript_8533/g.16534  ORF Transcript_8533/g.16534 Transcript_8533/m.16534 type:complete len:85 (-) Transcript_8533:1275-1529(-)